MSVKNRVQRLEQKTGGGFIVAITLGRFFDAQGNLIPTENGPPPNFEQVARSVDVSVSISDVTERLERRDDESHDEFMQRFHETG